MASPARFAAFLDGTAFYIALERPCARCGNFKKRVRDRSCYACHLQRGGENFEHMKAGIAPKATRSKDGHIDVLERRRRERNGEYLERSFDGLIARRWPLGRLEVTFPDDYHQYDLATLNTSELLNAMEEFPMLTDAMEWAGWTLPGRDR